MRRVYKWLWVMLLFWASPLQAQYTKIQGFCENGSPSVVIPGTQGSGAQKVQQSYPGCTVRVFNAGTVVLATIYADNVGTAKANPFTASTTAQWSFYAVVSNHYDVQLSGGGIPAPFTLGDFVAPPPNDWVILPNAQAYVPATGTIQPALELIVGGANPYSTPGIGPAPSTGSLFVSSSFADSTSGNISNIFSVAGNTGTRFTAGITGIGFIPNGSGGGGNVWGGQFTARAEGTGAGTLIAVNLEADMPTNAAGTTGISAEVVCGKSGADTNLTPCHSGLQFFNSQFSPFQQIIRIADTNGYSPISSTGSIIAGDGGTGVVAANGIHLIGMTFSSNAYDSTGFSIDGTGRLSATDFISLGNSTGNDQIKLLTNQSGINWIQSTHTSSGTTKPLEILLDSTGIATFNIGGGTTGQVIPTTDNVIALGGPSNRWQNLYVGNFSILGSSTTDLTLNNPFYVIVGNNGGFVAAGATTNASVAGLTVVNGSYVSVASNKSGTGTYLPMAFFTNGAEQFQITTAGNFATGGGTALITNAGLISPSGGTNIVYRCATAGNNRVGILTIVSADCGTTTDTGLRVP